MVINKHNLVIAKHCTEKPEKGYSSDVLHLTKNGTLAVNGPYSVSVTAVEPGAVGCISVDAAGYILDAIGNETAVLPSAPINGKMPPTAQYMREKPILFETVIEAGFLLKLAESIRDFEGKEVRIQFTGKGDPVRLDTQNKATGQRLEALLMPWNNGRLA